MAWLWQNVGLSAHTGEAFQLVVAWGGGLRSDAGWAVGETEAPRSGVLDPLTLAEAEVALRAVPINTYDGIQFFAWHRGELWVLGAARVEVGDGAVDPLVLDEAIGRFLLGHRLDAEAVTSIEGDRVVRNLSITPNAPEGRSVVPLPGGDGQPVAYLAWDTPQPGSEMLGRLLAPLALAVLLTIALAARGLRFVQASARNLVEAEVQATRAARTDALTGLPNRAAFNEVIARPAKAGARAVLFLDVNGFKRINDSIGHAAGDEVIVIVAERLSRLVRPDHFLARIAGDEFVFVLTSPHAGAWAELLAREVEGLLEAPLSVMGHQMRIAMAMGYAVQMDEQATGADLVRQADLAMYEAKRHPGSGLVGFNPMIEQASHDASIIEKALRGAMARGGELSIAYQPIVTQDGRLAHAEALARWTSPELGVVPPGRFIAVAEQAGLIVELGWRLFQLICDDLAAHPGLNVSLNVSPLQLMAPDSILTFRSELERRGVDPGRIEIELTESVVVDDARLASTRLHQIHDAGFSTALDDFGTGYSSVGYLRQMGFDTLKVDRSFVSQTVQSPKGRDVVSGIITMAHGMGLRVVCEGVETAEELEVLRELGCDLAQGYYLGRPMALTALQEIWQPESLRAAVA